MATTEYVLRTNDADGKSYGGFQYPREVGQRVAAPDWSSAPGCGGGLHGLRNGRGGVNWLTGDEWMVLAVDTDTNPIVDIGRDKCKCSGGTVAYIGDRDGAVEYLIGCVDEPSAVVFGTATAGYRGTAGAGYRGTATAGDDGTATAGDGGTATAGDDGTLIIKRWDGKRYRFSIAYVGEGGIKSDTPYILDADGGFVEGGIKASSR